ncbi:MAG TPA: hypothetical protein VGS19_07955 [Streptosporangiaceae bacterium]|nr:hypothetical protein [Streptosporangiaceae bacterium]
MPEPRFTVSVVPAIRVTLEPSSRDKAAMRRRYRHGTVPRGVSRGMSTTGSAALPVEIRNGLPEFRPYVYRGLGYDQFGDDDE